MPSPIIYDIRRVLTSKSVIILMAVMILLSLALVSSFTISTSNPQINTQVLSWYDSNGNYHFLGFAWNEDGQPASGVTFRVNLTITTQENGSYSVSCPTNSVYKSSPSTTDIGGEANFSISAPINPTYSACISSTEANGDVVQMGPFITPYVTSIVNPLNKSTTSQLIPPGQTVGIITGEPVETIFLNDGNEAPLLNWAGAYGSPPTNYPIYYKFFNNTEQCITSENSVSCSTSFNYSQVQYLTESQMQYLGNMSGYVQIPALPSLPSNIDENTSLLAIGVFYPNGTLVSFPSTFETQSLYNQQNLVSVSEANNIVFSFFQGIFGLFIPLLAILGSYNSYGKDRASGVLESVLAQPISRSSLSLSRFVSSFSAMAIAVSSAMLVVDTIYHFYTGAFFDGGSLLVTAGSFLVELAAFIGLMMLLSRLVKSSGLLIGLGIGLFLVFALFWSVIVLLIGLAINPSGFGSTAYDNLTVAAAFLNPAQYFSLVETYITHTLSLGGFLAGGFGIPITPSAYGISIFSLVAAAILWIGLPLACFLYLSIKKD